MDDRSDLDAPPDVEAAIDWLLAAGFSVTRLMSRDQPNGNKLIALDRADEQITLVRDRGQWELLMRGDGWAAGLHSLHEARTGLVFEQPPSGPLPHQHPADEVSWAEAVPAFFAWRERTPGWRGRVDAALEAGAERIRRRQG